MTTSLSRAVLWASVCSGAMIAQQVGAKAMRDALFLSNFGVDRWPVMLVVAAAVSIATVFFTSGLMARKGPAAAVPAAFLISTVLLIAESLFVSAAPGVVAVVLFLHVAVLGSVLISGFWSLINERFDPRTARQKIGRIVAWGTLGGLVGGFLAERITAMASVELVLPVLALLHGLCALATYRLSDGVDGARVAGESMTSRTRDGVQVLKRSRYLRNIAMLVFTVTVASAFLDFVFRSAVTTMYAEDSTRLAQFFAAFYAVTGLIVFLLQTLVGRSALMTAGLGWTLAFLPITVALGSAVSLLIPGAYSVILTRGGESVGRNSLFRSAYELLYMPVLVKDKRAAKSVIDVSVERFGDMVGGALVAAVLLLFPVVSGAIQLGLALILSLAALWLCYRLQRGYVRSLEANLSYAAESRDLPAVLQTGFIPRRQMETALNSTMMQQSFADMGSLPMWPTASLGLEETPRNGEEGAEGGGAEEHVLQDPVERSIAALESGDFDVVIGTLRRADLSHAELVPKVIQLLAWEEVYPHAVKVLRKLSSEHISLLVQSLRDPAEDFAVRRRIPRVLSVMQSQASVDGLLAGLNDKRFEVRYQSGTALSRIRHADQKGRLRIDEARIMNSILNEVKVGKKVWDGQRLLDDPDHESDDLYDEFLRYRANRSLEHVFRLLTLTLTPDPVRIAYRALNTSDINLRGTALEYLESVLPAEVQQGLWPYLEDHRPTDREAKPREKVLEDLLRSQVSVDLHLSAIRDAVKGKDSRS